MAERPEDGSSERPEDESSSSEQRQNRMDGILEYLIQSGIISDVFNNLFGGAGTNGDAFFGGGGHTGPRAPPSASKKSLQQLPTIVVEEEDLLDENNRSCCICLEPNNLTDRVKRLPCAHIFHENCILNWLHKTNTCPVCRYELETDDDSYEPVRLERMRSRKPRIHPYELERMSLFELQTYAQLYGIVLLQQTEEDVVRAAIRSSERVEIITTKAPTTDMKYTIEELRSMKVSELRQTMAKAGVFFDPKNVIEKEDMVRIFCNSGRFILVRGNNNGVEEEGTKKKRKNAIITTTTNNENNNNEEPQQAAAAAASLKNENITNEGNNKTTTTTARRVRSHDNNDSQRKIAQSTTGSSQGNTTVRPSSSTQQRSSNNRRVTTTTLDSNNNNRRRRSNNNNSENRGRSSVAHSVTTTMVDSRRQNQEDDDDDEHWC